MGNTGLLQLRTNEHWSCSPMTRSPSQTSRGWEGWWFSAENKLARKILRHINISRIECQLPKNIESTALKLYVYSYCCTVATIGTYFLWNPLMYLIVITTRILFQRCIIIPSRHNIEFFRNFSRNLLNKKWL